MNIFSGWFRRDPQANTISTAADLEKVLLKIGAQFAQSSNVSVTANGADGLPAAHRAVKLAAETLAGLPLSWSG